MNREFVINEHYILRKAVPTDANSLATLVKEGLPGYPFEYVYNPTLVRDELEEGRDYRIVAIYHNQVVATAVLGLGELMTEIKREVVHPLMRRNGLAKAMTNYLASYARELKLIPWSDVRADQIGMQRAALNAGLIPISLEPGKHVVYSHGQDGLEIGPARETMVHITSLRIDEQILYQDLAQWPKPLLRLLIENMRQAFNPDNKKDSVVYQRLPSAQEVSAKINQKLSTADDMHTLANPSTDIAIVEHHGTQLAIIKPDASAFILDLRTTSLPETFEVCKDLGLQVVTYYDQAKKIDLAEQGMQPTMIRPWQISPTKAPVWQVGWRKTINGYESSLHNIYN